MSIDVCLFYVHPLDGIARKVDGVSSASFQHGIFTAETRHDEKSYPPADVGMLDDLFQSDRTTRWAMCFGRDVTAWIGDAGNWQVKNADRHYEFHAKIGSLSLDVGVGGVTRELHLPPVGQVLFAQSMFFV